MTVGGKRMEDVRVRKILTDLLLENTAALRKNDN